jgi:hypothetical protein
MSRFFRFFLLLFFISNVSYAQKGKFESKEAEFLKAYIKFSESEDYESKQAQSDKFSEGFKKFISGNPETLSYDFKKLKDKLYIITSEDKKLKFYVWDTGMGGTMISFDQMIQYSSNGKVKTIYNSDTPYFVSEIIRTSIRNQTYYLVISNGIFSNKDQAQAVQAFTIKNDKLIDTDKIFKTKTKMLNKIEAEFDFFSVVDRPERPLQLIKFEQNKLYIPVVDEKGTVSKKFLVYQLNSNCFEYIGIK